MATEQPALEAEEQKCASCTFLGPRPCPPSCIFRRFLWPRSGKTIKLAENLHKYFPAENIAQLLEERSNFSEEERIDFVGFLLKTTEDFEEDKIAGPYSKIKEAAIEADDGDDGGDEGGALEVSVGDVVGDVGAPAGTGDVALPPAVVPADSSSADVGRTKMIVRKSTGGKAPRRQLATEVDAPAPGGSGDGNEAPVCPVLAPGGSGDANESVPPPAEGSLIADIDASGLIVP